MKVLQWLKLAGGPVHEGHEWTAYASYPAQAVLLAVDVATAENGLKYMGLFEYDPNGGTEKRSFRVLDAPSCGEVWAAPEGAVLHRVHQTAGGFLGGTSTELVYEVPWDCAVLTPADCAALRAARFKAELGALGAAVVALKAAGQAPACPPADAAGGV